MKNSTISMKSGRIMALYGAPSHPLYDEIGRSGRRGCGPSRGSFARGVTILAHFDRRLVRLGPRRAPAARFNRGSTRSPLIDALVQIPHDPGRHAPDVALAEGHCIVAAHHALAPLVVATVQRVVLHVHQEGKRDLEGVVDLGGIEQGLEGGI